MHPTVLTCPPRPPRPSPDFLPSRPPHPSRTEARSRARLARLDGTPPLVLLAFLLLLFVPRLTIAQRAPVLPQIHEPHPYYYRELYLPQLTSGPSAAAWSPDGTELVYSRRGTLWRQRVDSDRAVQLTDSGGYDYQPDWSPDGSRVAFVRYTGTTIQLCLLDLASGVTRVLRDDGAVHLEPRWSPDGTRLAWVATSFEGRFHVFVAPVIGDSLGAPRRITEDRDSGLPRYYYSPFDHYLSPTWSPDGRELLLVSNRGRIWGTGGIWRLPVDRASGDTTATGVAMRLVFDEETMWKARPDWSRDGRRVVYASYAGRQWHQLWLTTADPRTDGATTPLGGEPLQLTYGDFDATNPRWSPDGRHIAYISNESGNTALWIIDLPGGRRRPLNIRHTTWRAPTGALRLVVTNAATGASVPARASVRGDDGRHAAPDDAWMQGDDGFDRTQRRFEFDYFHLDAPVIVALRAGEATVEVMRGLEYAHVVRRIAVRAGETTTVRVALRRIDDLSAHGWVSGDLHVHMNYGGMYRNTPARLVRQARAEDLRVVENLIVNKEERVPDIGYFTGANDPASTRDVLLRHDQEFHTSVWGHHALLGLSGHVRLPGYAAYTNTAAQSLVPMNADVMSEARAEGALAGWVHPFEAWPEPSDTTSPLTNEFPVDLALGLLDYYEALGFVEDLMVNQRVWYAALSAGFRLPAGAGTDAMANYASLRGPVGMNRVYAKVNGPLTHQRFLDAIRAGRTFATNGPLLRFAIARQEAGGEVTLPAGMHRLRATVSLRSFVGIDSLQVVRNGVVVASLRVGAGGTRADTTLTLTTDASGWYLLRAWSIGGRHPVLDVQPLATTSPIYVTVAGVPMQSTADARYFLAWTERLRANAVAFTAWNDARERTDVLARIDAALRVWRERAR
ncbi:MAG: CehA/McbA family metallohydrolase [Gemmatimonadota bacterium]